MGGVTFERMIEMKRDGMLVINTYLPRRLSDSAYSVKIRCMTPSDPGVRLIYEVRFKPRFPDEMIMNISASMASQDDDDEGCKLTAKRSTDQLIMRMFSIMGGSVFSHDSMPLSKVAVPDDGLVIAGLDIETSMKSESELFTGFALPGCNILCCTVTIPPNDKSNAWKCYVVSTVEFDRSDLAKEYRKVWFKSDLEVEIVRDSACLVRRVMAIVYRESPDYVSVHNGYSFDSTRMAAHGYGDVEANFEQRRLGNTGTGMVMDFGNGTLMLDTMYYAMKTDKSRYSSGLSLKAMCKLHGIGNKLPVDLYDETSKGMSIMIVYNVVDAYLHSMLCEKMGMVKKMAIMASMSMSCMSDSTLNNTGVMSFCLVSSVCFFNGTSIDMRESRTNIDLKGGMVLDQHPGVHEDVALIDVKSMYPSVIAGFGIFVDSTVLLTPLDIRRQSMSGSKDTRRIQMLYMMILKQNDTIVTSGNTAYMRIPEGVIIVEMNPNSVISSLMDDLTDLRSTYRGSGPNSGHPCAGEVQNQIKIMSNSVYGMFGAGCSIMSSKACACAVTCIARNIVREMLKCARDAGATVVYGDTDSAFVTVSDLSKSTCGEDLVTDIISRFDDMKRNGPLQNIVIEKERIMTRLLLVARKSYAYVVGPPGDSDEAQELTIKGMVSIRGNVPPLVKRFQREIVTQILTSKIRMTPDQITTSIASKIKEIKVMMITGAVSKMDMVSLQKSEGIWSYVYTDQLTQSQASVPVETFDETRVNISMRSVMDALVRSIARIMKVCDCVKSIEIRGDGEIMVL
jgi:DNA polymerase elongation subunit (family B)